MFQIVRRANANNPGGEASGRKLKGDRENFLTTALITVLSVNIFMVSSVLSFCLFVFWYPA